jgi:uncharacterized protein YcbK (DUF882 family)
LVDCDHAPSFPAPISQPAQLEERTMSRCLFAAATVICVCALAVPADARGYRADDWTGSEGNPFDFRSFGGDEEPSYRTEERPRVSRRQRSGLRRQAAKPATDVARPRLPQLALLLPPTTSAAPPGNRKSDGMRACLKPAALALLDRIEALFGPMQVISTCRPGARIAGSGRISKHASGEAVDFNAGKRKSQVVQWLIANHKSGGTMTYADMSHIHVDVGYHFVALNAGGRR